MSSSPVLHAAPFTPSEELTFHLDEDDVEHEDAVWKTSYINKLPDSAFLYIEPGGSPDAEGKTTPRSLRHFPYKNDTGDVDIVHVRDAIGRIPQASIPEGVKAKLQAKAQKLLASYKTDEVSHEDVIRFDASKLRPTPQGGLRGPAGVSRVGVFMYRHADGAMAGKIVREFRPPEEVFHADSLATLDQAPITEGHPAMLNRTNTTKLSKGQLTEIHHDETHVLADAVLQDGKIVDGVLSGKLRDFSPGYTCKYDWTPGVWNGQPYDLVQRHIRYNHVAILPPNRGRQGSTVAMRFDAASITETPMIVHLDGKDYDLADESQRAAYHAAMKAKEDAANARADQAEARADSLDAELKPRKEREAKEARATLESQARKVIGEKGKDVRFDGLTDRQVREKAIGDDKCAGKSDEYVAARFDQLVEAPPAAAPAADPALEVARQALEPAGGTQTQTTAAPPSWTERWREPLTASKDKKK